MKLKQCWVILLCFALLAAPALRGQTANPDAAKRAGEILQDSMKAAGGDALFRVERIEFTSSGPVFGPMGEMAVDIGVKVAFPDKVRMTNVIGQFGTLENGFDGKAGWLLSPQGAMDLPADMNNEALRGIAMTAGIGIYRQVKDGTAKLEFTGEKEFNGKKALEIEWVGPSGKVKLYIDPETKLLAGARCRIITMQGAADEERRWSDYRAVDGVQFPYKWVAFRDGQPYSSQTVKEVKFNSPMDAATFAKP
jgi:hypothetical protein